MAKITTVLGEIDPEELGFTSMHDHTFLDMRIAAGYLGSLFPFIHPEDVKFAPENYAMLKSGIYLLCPELKLVDDMEGLEKELSFFKASGGNSLCVPTPIGLRMDIQKEQELSRRTGLNIICATGLYTESSRPAEYLGKSEDFYYRLFKNEIENGIDGTDVHPGVLKGAYATVGENGISESEIASVNAIARLCSETNMSMHIHTDCMVGDELLYRTLESTVEKYGVNRERVLVCHMDNRIAGGVTVDKYLSVAEADRTLNLDVQKRLLDKGYNIGLDTWGLPVENPTFFFPDDFERTKALITLLDSGYGGQITLGNDFSSKLCWRQYGGYGYTRFIDFGLAALERLGRKKEINQLVIENPTRILAY